MRKPDTPAFKIIGSWILPLVAGLFLLPLRLGAAGFKEANSLFDKGLYQEALKKYEEVARTDAGDKRLKALYRSCEAEALLFRYGKAFERLRKAGLPRDPLWRARFLILKSELSREFLKQYGHRARRDVVEGEKEVFRRTPDQLHAEVAAAFQELWGLRKTLLKRRIIDEAFFVDVA